MFSTHLPVSPNPLRVAGTSSAVPKPRRPFTGLFVKKVLKVSGPNTKRRVACLKWVGCWVNRQVNNAVCYFSCGALLDGQCIL